jgi:hypothetical protein
MATTTLEMHKDAMQIWREREGEIACMTLPYPIQPWLRLALHDITVTSTNQLNLRKGERLAVG